MGESVINTQIDMGYESSSGFRDAVSKIMGGPPTKFNRHFKSGLARYTSWFYAGN
ncbi:putative methylated-DNA---cysteine methyltransferase-like protein [Rickettsia amblyommatis str. Darkwater]|uniref:Putative methylated-DNA---cysteine methyltransferase-like protein n=2 Tax=Rickettsia amblyommatis TaxID=33989 RepID=A0A0F3N3G4_RICAM|nr:putative methylated-DNA---cysteine methyltransferase-like protein [Rickettsia amblyommatis str. Ac/Pa]KJV93028.1 putative methylated-DNA---cysteine methyltransferase-like protein [Rickettsia amblyommatis str. Darkwater]